MPKLIKKGEIVEDSWVLLTQLSSYDEITQAGKQVIISLPSWLQAREKLADFDGKIGLWLDSDQNPREIPDEINIFEVIALNFPVFSDGRAYSYARELRSDLGFEGEIRAIGDVLRDQLYYMSSCGFDAFSLRQDKDPETALDAFDDFKEGYQASVIHPVPLFRRR